MKKLLFIFLIITSNIFVFANSDTTLILQEIKNLRGDMNTLRADMNKRFEQVDKRFEQVYNQFDTLKELMFVLMAFIFASPFLAIYLKDKKDDKDLDESLKAMNI